jgi:hypothetical protein
MLKRLSLNYYGNLALVKGASNMSSSSNRTHF